MRILALLNSNVNGGGDANIPREELFPARMQGPLSKAIGEEIEIEVRSVWPTPRLHILVDRWVTEFQPDLVVFPVSSFWFLYESTPVRLERRLAAPGRLLGRASRRAAATPWLAHNRVFQWSRKQTQKAIGGQAWFTPEQVVEAATKSISAVLRNESSYLVVFGPGGGKKWARGARHGQALEASRRMVDERVGAFCRAHHVEFWDDVKRATIKDPRPSSLQGDDLHLDREGHRRLAEFQFELSLGMVERALAATRDGVATEPAATPVA